MKLILLDSEMATLRGHITPKGELSLLSEEDWEGIAPDRRDIIAEAINMIDEMGDADEVRRYVGNLFGNGVEIDERQGKSSLEDATSRLIEQAPGRWAEMGEKDRRYMLNLVDRLETEGLRLKDEATRKRMPELHKLIDLTTEEWHDISAEHERRILIKLQDLADHTEGESNHKVRFVSEEDARQLIDRLKAGDQEALDVVIKYCMGEVYGLTAS